MALDRGAAGGDREPGEQPGEPTEVAGTVSAVAELHVLDCLGLDTGALDGVLIACAAMVMAGVTLNPPRPALASPVRA